MPLFSGSRRVEQMVEDLETTMREVKSLRVEWDETYEKLLKLYRKTAAERAKLEKLATPPETEEPGVTAQETGNGNGATGFLSPKQKLIQQQILQRRAMMR